MSEWKIVPAGTVATQRKDIVTLEPGVEYRTMGVRWYGKGAYDRGTGSTETIKAKRLFRAHEGDFVFNRIDTQNGAFDVVPVGLHGALATNEFPLYVADPGSCDGCVGHVRPGRAGRCPPRVSMSRAMRASGSLKPKAMRVRRRILVLTDSVRPFESPWVIAARIGSR